MISFIFQLLLTLAMSFIYILACIAAGCLIKRIVLVDAASCTSDQPDSIGQLVCTFLVGLGVVANIWLLLGLAKVFYWQPIMLIILVLLIIGRQDVSILLINSLTALLSVFKSFSSAGLIWQSIYFVLALTAIVQLFSAIVSIPDCDSLAFYLTQSKMISHTHQLMEVPGGYSIMLQLPILGELHMAALMSTTLGGREAGILLVFTVYIATGVLLALVASSGQFCIKAGAVAIAILLTCSGIYDFLLTGKVDIYAAAMGVGALYALIYNLQYSIRIAGILTGMAIMAKITYLVTLPVALLLVLFSQEYLESRLNNRKIKLKPILQLSSKLLIFALLPLIPHLIKNAILFNEPFSPFYHFSNAVKFPVNQSWSTPSDAAKTILMYPISLVYGNYANNFSVFLITFAPFIVFFPNKGNLNDTRIQLALAGCAGCIMWHIIQPQVFALRYILGSLLCLIPLIAASTKTFYEQRRSRLLNATIVSSILVVLLFTSLMEINKVIPFLMLSHDQLMERDAERHLLTAVNNDAPYGAHVILIMYTRYWLRGDLLVQMHKDEKQIDQTSESTTPKPANEWDIQKSGVHYIVVSHIFPERLSKLRASPPPPGIHVKALVDRPTYAAYRVEKKYEP